MISFIKGNAEILQDGIIVIENNGIGYKINVPESVFSYVHQHKVELKIFTHMNVKEDSISLYGFLTLEDLKIFEKLITVSGVGPKGAISLLSTMTAREIASAIITSDIKALSSGQGIGKKIAHRIVLELKDKIDTMDAIYTTNYNIEDIAEDTTLKEVLEALISLGFSKPEVIKVLDRIEDKGLNSSKLISICLKELSK